MTCVPVTPLKTTWPNMSSQDKDSIAVQLGGYMSQIRSIPKPETFKDLYVCATDGTPCRDVLLSWLGLRDIRSDEELRTLLMETTEKSGWGDKRKLGLKVPPSSRSVFTHTDLNPKNIMVDGAKITGILDWETSGWYPEYWESLNMGNPLRPYGDWRERTIKYMPEECRNAETLATFDKMCVFVM